MTAQNYSQPMNTNPTIENQGAAVSVGSDRLLGDCAVQFYANGLMIEDTDLISRDEADALINKHKPEFIRCCERGDSAELALWVNMRYPGNYRDTAIRVNSEDVILKNGIAFTLTPVFA